MNGAQPKRQLHSLRGGDGTSLPETAPPERWPDLATLAPYWESFMAFARSHLGKDGRSESLRLELIQRDDGTWKFEAHTTYSRQHVEPTGEAYTEIMTYEPEDDEIRFKSTRDDSEWVMEEAFGSPFEATSAL